MALIPGQGSRTERTLWRLEPPSIAVERRESMSAQDAAV